MNDIIEPKLAPKAEEVNNEPRDIVIAGIENPKGHDEFSPIVNMFKLQKFLGITKPDYKEQDILKGIYQYYEKLGLTNIDDIFIQINTIEQKLGSVPIGQTRLNYLWNYLKVLSQINQYENLKKSYERI